MNVQTVALSLSLKKETVVSFVPSELKNAPQSRKTGNVTVRKKSPEHSKTRVNL